MNSQTQADLNRYSIVPKGTPEAIVFRCFDPRFQEPVDEFLELELDLPRGHYIDVSVAGGVASFSEQLRFPKEFRFMKDNTLLALTHFLSIRRAILISHENCAKYKVMMEILRLVAENTPEKQRNDLTAVTSKIVEIAERQIEVRRFYAKFANPEHTEVVFEELK